MGIDIPYMGTKRHLAPRVAEVISTAKDGPLLDAFSGMGTVGANVGPARQIWTNDVQEFASAVCKSLFNSSDYPLNRTLAADLNFHSFKESQEKLRQIYSESIDLERNLLESRAFSVFAKRRLDLTNSLNRIKRKNLIDTSLWNLFCTIYSDTYFGVSQCIDIDSILYAIASGAKDNHLSCDQSRWLRVALGKAVLRVSNTTGHFAQFLKPKEHTYRKFVQQRKRCIWSEWLSSIETLSPIGESTWRKCNLSFREDSELLLRRLKRRKNKPAVVYTDPPYTDDQYSRYYHILETLLLYDFPVTTGTGLYRQDRFRTSFSVKSKAPRALASLINSCRQLGADLVLSYPTNGLVYEAGYDVWAMLKESFSRVDLIDSISYTHSTFGASKGAIKSSVVEQLFIARS